jgi:hypothetical protein
MEGGGGGGNVPPDVIEGEDVSDREEDEDGDGGDTEAEDTWPSHTMQWFNTVQQDINTSLRFTGRGDTARFLGKMPFRYCQLAKPSEDPEAYFPDRLLEMGDFSLPPPPSLVAGRSTPTILQRGSSSL